MTQVHAVTRPRQRWRAVSIAVACLALLVVLLEWTVAALDVFGVGRRAELGAYLADLCERNADGVLLHRGGSAASFAGRFALEFDALGLRRASRPADGDAARLLVVGGVAALGFGVDDGSTFARRFELHWTGARVAVGNAGHLAFRLGEAGVRIDAARAFAPRVVLLVVERPDHGARLRLAAAARPGGALGSILPALSAAAAALVEDADAGAADVDDEPVEPALGVAALRAAALGARLVVALAGSGRFDDVTAACGVLDLPVADLRFRADEQRLPLFADGAVVAPTALAHDLLRKRLLDAFAAHPEWLAAR